MTNDILTLEASPRTALGKKNAAIRRSGLVPLHVYGLDKEPNLLQAETRMVTIAIRKSGRTAPVRILVSGRQEEEMTLIRDVTVHPVSGRILHVDFIRISKEKPVDLEVPVVLVNTDRAPVTRGAAANITQSVYRVKILCKPFIVPQVIEVDCSLLAKTSDSIVVGDLPLPEGASLITNPLTRILFIQISRAARSAATEAEDPSKK